MAVATKLLLLEMRDWDGHLEIGKSISVAQAWEELDFRMLINKVLQVLCRLIIIYYVKN
jgi:hypothetical protein